MTKLIKTRYGQLKIANEVDLISKSLICYGEWAQNELDILKIFINAGDVILDIGAFIGTHTIAFSKFVGKSGKVYSFEANTQIFNILKENKDLNSLDNVYVLNRVVSDECGKANIAMINIATNDNLGAIEFQENNSTDSFEIIKTSIDSLELPKISFIKIDVEGMEPTVLKGAYNKIKSDQPIIFLECNTLDGGSKCLHLLKDFDYKCYGINAMAYNPKNFNNQQNDIFFGGSEIGLLFIHSSYTKSIESRAVSIINDVDELAMFLYQKKQYLSEVLLNKKNYQQKNIKHYRRTTLFGNNYFKQKSVKYLQKTKTLFNWFYGNSKQEKQISSCIPIIKNDDELNITENFKKILSLSSFEDSIVSKYLKSDNIDLLQYDALDRALESSIGHHSQAIVSISHDNYKKNSGGIQLIVSIEEKEARNKNINYIHIYPMQPLPRLANEEEIIKVNITVNGMPIGCSEISVFIKTIQLYLLRHKVILNIAIHHLLGFSISSINDILNYLNPVKALFWVHDYFILCESYTLLRNGLTYCGAPPLISNECNICIFGTTRKTHLSRINSFISKNNLTFIYPSKIVKNIIESKYNIIKNSLIANYLDIYSSAQILEQNKEPLIHIAFVGTPAEHKGWNLFLKIIERDKKYKLFKFTFFGSASPEYDSLNVVNVNVKAGNCNAMVNALNDFNVDLVIMANKWPETFCITAHECAAANVAILSLHNSGNLSQCVEKNNWGKLFRDNQEILDYLYSDECKKYVEQLRSIPKSKNQIFYSGFSINII